MRLRNLLLLVLAVVLAGGTAMLAHSYLAAERVRQIVQAAPPPPRPERSILVAHADIARGDIIKSGDLVWQVWPDNAITANYIASGGKDMPQNFSGWVAINSVAAGAPVTKGALISPQDNRYLAAVLKPGMRAIQVTADLPTGTVNGDRVDMMVNFALPKDYYDDSKPGWPERETGSYGSNAVETVLSGLRILKIVGLQLEVGKPLEQKATGAVPIIFEVTPKQAEIIALAGRMGQLTFTLDSLRHGSVAVAANRQGVMLAAAHEQADPLTAAAATTLAPASADPVDPPESAEPSYMTDVEVNPMLRVPSKEIKASATILRGTGSGGGKPEEVPILLRCTETACAHFDNLPTKLVGSGALAGVKP